MSEFLTLLHDGSEPDPSKNIFSDIWGEYERVILQSLVTSFGLDFLVHDQRGGDVDTFHSVQETGTFKNQEYQHRYEDRGQYDAAVYHGSDPAYRAGRQQYNKTGESIEDAYDPGRILIYNKGLGPWRRASLDHVVAAHEIHDDPTRFLADLDGASLANDPENLRYTSMSLNSKMKDMPIDEFLRWCDEHPDKVNWDGVPGAPLPAVVRQRLKEEDSRAREHYTARVTKAYYSSPRFYADAALAAGKRGLEMGARQALGFIFIEIWFACKEELSNVPPGSDFKDCLEAIIHGIPKGVNNARLKYKGLITSFEQGFAAGALASLTTTICNVFFTTEQTMVRYIRQGYAAIVQAGNVLLINPNDLMLGDQLKTATVILATGASVIAGTFVGDKIAKTPIGMAPHVGPVLVRFTSTLISGLLSCTLLILLDRSKMINDLIARMNQYTTEERELRQLTVQFTSIAAEIEGYDLSKFAAETMQFEHISAKISEAKTEQELSTILDAAFIALGIKLPWEGDFDSFMSGENRTLVFD